MLTQDFARETFTGRAKKFYVARDSFSGRARTFQARAKFDTRGLISREDVSQSARDSDNIVLTKMISRETRMISRETRMISRETRMISRETKRWRAKVHTSLQTASNFKVIKDCLDRFEIFLRAILVRKQITRHVEQQASDSSTSENNEQGQKQHCAWTIKWLSSC